MDTIKVLKKSIRDYKLPSILTPIFIIGEVVLETLIPTVMAVLIDEISKSISMDPIIKYGLILLAMALASLLCGLSRQVCGDGIVRICKESAPRYVL